MEIQKLDNFLNEDKKTSSELYSKLNSLNSTEEQAKLVWMWIKQESITLKTFTELFKQLKGE